MGYTLLLYAGLYSCSVCHQFITISFRSIEALLFMKKIVFRVGKKAMADSQALL